MSIEQNFIYFAKIQGIPHILHILHMLYILHVLHILNILHLPHIPHILHILHIIHVLHILHILLLHISYAPCRVFHVRVVCLVIFGSAFVLCNALNVSRDALLSSLFLCRPSAICHRASAFVFFCLVPSFASSFPTAQVLSLSLALPLLGFRLKFCCCCLFFTFSFLCIKNFYDDRLAGCLMLCRGWQSDFTLDVAAMQALWRHLAAHPCCICGRLDSSHCCCCCSCCGCSCC